MKTCADEIHDSWEGGNVILKIGNVDFGNYDYMIIYEDENGTVNSWTLPEGSFQVNYKSMIKRGCKVLRVFKQMNTEEILQTMNSK